MKKILYIVPILVFAMVVLTQDAKAQTTGQVGNASNAITQAAVTSVTQAALAATTTTGGGTTVAASANGNVTTPAPAIITITLVTSLSIQTEMTPISVSSFQAAISATLPITSANITSIVQLTLVTI